MIKKRLEKLENHPKGKLLLQFIKFGLVGVSNTAISYAIEMLCYYVLFSKTGFEGLRKVLTAVGITLTAASAKIVVTSILSFIVSVTNSYYWNSRHVFADGQRHTTAQHVATYFKTMACYALTGLLLSPWLKSLLVNNGVSFWVAALLVLIVTIPLNFVMNKLWAYRSRK